MEELYRNVMATVIIYFIGLISPAIFYIIEKCIKKIRGKKK